MKNASVYPLLVGLRVNTDLLTALANVPLFLFFVFFLITYNGAPYEAVKAAFGNPLVVALFAVLGGWYMSVQHETLHGHPTRLRWLNELMIFATPTFWLPFGRYRETHLQHHHDIDLTDPVRDSLGATIVLVTHELASIFAIANNSVFLDADTKTMIATGDPKVLARGDVEKVRNFLQRGGA